MEDVEDFIEQNGLSPKVAGRLRHAPEAVQRAVLGQGSLATCRDPNAGCVGRMRKAENCLMPSWSPPSRDEVEGFIEANELNERAGEALRGAAPAVQWHVLEQGSLLSCREPSAGCIGRISKAQRNLDPALLAPPLEGPSWDEVEDFLQENGLDERAAEALRTAPRWQQRHVMGQGSLATCRDPSAGLMGRLRRAQEVDQRPASEEAAETTAVAAYELDEFIYANGLNDRAADVLRSADGAVQRRVLEQGSLHATRAPSAACVARVRKLQRLGVRSQSGYPSLDAVESFIYEHQLDRKAAQALEAAHPSVQESVLSSQLYGNTSRACMKQIRAAEAAHLPKAWQSEKGQDVEGFISANELNERAAEALRGVSSEVQWEVMSQGSLATCRDPNAGCIGRIAKAQGAYRQPRPPRDGVEAFIRDNELNDRAAEILRSVPREVQEEVLDQGPLRNCRDPNASCIGRISKAQKSTSLAADLEAFVREHDLNERAVAILRDVSEEVLRAVLDQGSLRGCRDANAGCIGRVKRAQQELRDGARGSKRSYEEASDRGRGRAHRRLEREVEAFVRDHHLSERATSVLREQKPEVQEMVLGGGSLHGTRDMSASCMGRIRKAQQAASRITSSSVRRVPRRSRTPRSGRASLSEVVQAVGSSLNRGRRG